MSGRSIKTTEMHNIKTWNCDFGDLSRPDGSNKQCITWRIRILRLKNQQFQQSYQLPSLTRKSYTAATTLTQVNYICLNHNVIYNILHAYTEITPYVHWLYLLTVYFKYAHNAKNSGLGSNNNISESRLKSCVIAGDLWITVRNSANLTDHLVVALLISLGDAGVTSKQIPSKKCSQTMCHWCCMADETTFTFPPGCKNLLCKTGCAR